MYNFLAYVAHAVPLISATLLELKNFLLWPGQLVTTTHTGSLIRFQHLAGVKIRLENIT